MLELNFPLNIDAIVFIIQLVFQYSVLELFETYIMMQLNRREQKKKERKENVKIKNKMSIFSI